MRLFYDRAHKLLKFPLTTKVRNGELFYFARKFIVCDFTFIVRAVSNPATVDKCTMVQRVELYDGTEGRIRIRIKSENPPVIFLSEGFGR